MKCHECHTKYNTYGMVGGSISLFCRECYVTTWLKIPEYIPKTQREGYADTLFEKDTIPPNNLMEDINEM